LVRHISSELIDGVVRIELAYDNNQLFQDDAAKVLSEEVSREYEKAKGTEPTARSCLVVIVADTAASPVVKALFELYRAVGAVGGSVGVVGYPAEFIDSINSLGLPSLAGFDLFPTEDEALSELRGSPGSN
jgi:hypothetical protein